MEGNGWGAPMIPCVEILACIQDNAGLGEEVCLVDCLHLLRIVGDVAEQ
jgi:hypothetical protein